MTSKSAMLAKKQLAKCSNDKCVKEGAALLRLESTFIKELKTLDKKKRSGKLSKAELVKEIKNIGVSNGVRSAAQSYTACIKTKCAKEQKTRAKYPK
jgi:hypothetical protein